MTTLQITHLRFSAIAQTDINLGGHYAGNNLRNALAAVLLRATCPEAGRRTKPTPEHTATCPACWIIAAESAPGSVVRPYTVIPPLPPRPWLAAGEPFTFGLTLFGSGFQFLPYFVLAMAEVGQGGFGPGRGTFTIESIHAINPFQQQSEILFQPPSTLVHVPTLHVTWETMQPQVAPWSNWLAEHNDLLTLRFLTPLRLEANKTIYQTPDFAILFRRLLYRFDELGRQFAAEPRRDYAEVQTLHQLADQVRLVSSETQWHELHGYSGRRGGKTPASGLVGTAVYHTPNWQPLLPYLLFGQATQVGKLTVKGNGIYMLNQSSDSYWESFFA